MAKKAEVKEQKKNSSKTALPKKSVAKKSEKKATPTPKKTAPKSVHVDEPIVAHPPKATMEEKAPNRIPLRVNNRKPIVIAKPQPAPLPEIDTAKAVAFAMSIAQEMKRSARKEEKVRSESEIRLSRRPTTRAQGKNTVKFPASDLNEFRKKLLEERKKAESGANAMKASGFEASDDHEVDGGDGTSQTMRLQALGQVGVINRTIQQIEEALHRIDDGTYGVCTVCGQLIRKPRLMNQPFVLTCMECQSEMERNRG
jgi:DnaK suppressor protein